MTPSAKKRVAFKATAEIDSLGQPNLKIRLTSRLTSHQIEVLERAAALVDEPLRSQLAAYIKEHR